jgi:hypothetical protein
MSRLNALRLTNKTDIGDIMKYQRIAFASLLVGRAASCLAADFDLADDVKASVNVTATAGTIIRTDSPSQSTYAHIPSSAVPGVAPGQLVGQTGGSDLNFKKHQAVRKLLKAMVDLDVHTKSLGAFVRIDGWDDFALGHDNAAYGNYPNGFKPGTPLSDRGLAPDAKFSNVRTREAYLYGRADDLGVAHVELRAGRQVLNWGVSQFFTGGLGSVTNPYDTAAQFRPGALPQESKVPIGMVSLTVAATKDWGVDAYVPYEFRPANVPGCGTFFDVASVTPQGCDIVGPFGAPIPGTPLSTASSLTEQSLLASGYYLHRQEEKAPDGSHQFGLSLRYTSSFLSTEFRGYAAETDTTNRNVYSLTIEDVNGSTLPAGVAGALQRLIDPNGMKYGVVYVKGTHVYGASFDTKLDPTQRVFGEVAYRPDQPIGLSPIDLLLAGLLRSPTSLLQERKDILSVAPGATFDGYDRHPVITANLGANKAFSNVFGAERIGLAAELGFSHVSGLPSPEVLRYGRGLAYGAAPYLVGNALTACTESMPGVNGVPGKTCTYDGYITTNSWGVRGRVAATYGGVFFGASLTPSLTLAKDVKGYSYDSTFTRGRLISKVAVRADWGRSYFLEAALNQYRGGKYNLMADRGNLALVAGASF